MRTVKKIGTTVALLALGVILGVLLARPAEVALGQAEPQLNQRFAVVSPPSPCNLAVQSRIVVAEDGTASGSLIAHPPSPCTALTLDIRSVPEGTARCEQSEDRRRVKKVSCEFDVGHQETTFYFNSNAADQ